MYLTQALHRHVRQSPNKVAVADARRRLTWRELSSEAARFAAALHCEGVGPGKRVAILSANRVEFVTGVFGTFWAGAVIVPINTRWTVPEIRFALHDCGARVLCLDAPWAALADQLTEGLPDIATVILLDEIGSWRAKGYAGWLAGHDDLPDPRVGGGALAAIMYTGGTTGRPKGVMLSHDNLAWSMLGTIAATDGPTTVRHLHVAPLFHVGALSLLLIAVATGAASYLMPAFDPAELLAALARWEIDEVFLVPTMIRAVIDHPAFADQAVPRAVGGIRRIRYGASPIDYNLLGRALKAFPQAGFVQGYGMTEASPVATILPASDHDLATVDPRRLRSAGRATAACEVRIVKDEAEVAPGEVGEIVVRGPNVMQGYWNLPEETAKTIRDGWLHTGDAGFMDESGYVTVVDRIKDMIITGGENVYSAEVEDALASHPDVAQVAVIALPDEKWGERVHAVIVPRSGLSPAPADLVAHCRARIAAYKVPRTMAVVAALPLTAAGKPHKVLLRSDCAYH